MVTAPEPWPPPQVSDSRRFLRCQSAQGSIAHAAVPEGCYPCEAEAAEHCGMDEVTSANSLIQALTKH